MNSELFSQALTFAAEVHCTQVRKISGVPYLAHLLGVASIVLEYGGSEAEAIAALLHDAIEDGGGAPIRAEIQRRFGGEVAAIVDGCTESDRVPKPPWRERKKSHLNRLARASDSVQLVTAADKIYNLRSLIKDYKSLGDEMWQYFHGGKQGTIWYYQSLLEIWQRQPITSTVIFRDLQELVMAFTHLVSHP